MSAPSLPTGTLVGARYRIHGTLAASASVSTYTATAEDGRGVVLKLYSPEVGNRPELMGALQQYNGTVNALPESAAVHVLDAGYDTETGAPFLASEYVAWPSLATVIAQGLTPPERASLLLTSLARSLEPAHAMQMAHQSLRPSNVFVAPVGGAIRLTDFGAIVVRGPVLAPDELGAALGFLAPEQLPAGTATGPASDVYASVLLTFFAMTGGAFWRSFTTSPIDPVAWRAETAHPPRASERARELGVGVPAVLDPIFARALSPSPADRYPSVGALAQAFAAACQEGGIAIPTSGSAPGIMPTPPSGGTAPAAGSSVASLSSGRSSGAPTGSAPRPAGTATPSGAPTVTPPVPVVKFGKRGTIQLGSESVSEARAQVAAAQAQMAAEAQSAGGKPISSQAKQATPGATTTERTSSAAIGVSSPSSPSSSGVSGSFGASGRTSSPGTSGSSNSPSFPSAAGFASVPSFPSAPVAPAPSATPSSGPYPAGSPSTPGAPPHAGGVPALASPSSSAFAVPLAPSPPASGVVATPTLDTGASPGAGSKKKSGLVLAVAIGVPVLALAIGGVWFALGGGAGGDPGSAGSSQQATSSPSSSSPAPVATPSTSVTGVTSASEIPSGAVAPTSSPTDTSSPDANAPNVRLSCVPDCDELKVDGKIVTSPLTLVPGTHRVIASKPGYATIYDAIKVPSKVPFAREYKLREGPAEPPEKPKKPCGTFVNPCPK